MISNHCVQERVILPLGDILTGQSVSKYLRFLQKSRYWSREEIDRFQNERLRLLITHAYGHVPFYREEMDKLQLTPADIRTKEDLRLLPIVTKAMIKKEGITFIDKYHILSVLENDNINLWEHLKKVEEGILDD